MGEFNFIGPSSASRSLTADCERTINLFPETVASLSYYSATADAHGKNKWVLYGTPGLTLLGTLPQGPVRGLYSGDGQSLYCVAGSGLYQLYQQGNQNPDGSGLFYRLLGDVGAGTTPAKMFANGTQLFVTAGLNGYLANGVTVQPVTAGVIADYLDGYYIALQIYSRQFNISAPNDGTSWDPLDFAIAEGGPDHLVSLLVCNRELWLFGQQHIEVWDDTGNADFPFQRNASGFIEQGCISAWSPQKLGNSLLWLGADARGGGVLWRADGYTPVRVSTKPVEWAWSQYSFIADAISWTYEDSGHSFYVLWFPTADATWVYDLTENAWHERQWLDPVTGFAHAHRASCHAWCFNDHIVGDRENGNVYVMAQTVYQDNGQPIQRTRIAPHISNEEQPMFYWQLQLDCQVGGAPAVPLVDGNGKPRDAQVTMSFSDDGGRTWSNEKTVSCGAAGAYMTRAIWRRLGRARDRVFKVVASDPIAVAWINAYLQTTGGTPQ